MGALGRVITGEKGFFCAARMWAAPLCGSDELKRNTCHPAQTQTRTCTVRASQTIPRACSFPWV